MKTRAQIPMSKQLYQSPESIRAMKQSQRIEALQEILFEHKQKIPQGDFKTGQDILKALFDEEERRRFENECVWYNVFFIRLVQEVDVHTGPGAGPDDCTNLVIDDCCGQTTVTLTPKTEKVSLRLHPLLVELINERCCFINQSYPADGSSVYDPGFLEIFLQEKGRNELQELLDAQYRETIHQITDNLRGRTRVLQTRGCTETELGQQTTVLELEHKVILHKILLRPSIIVS